MKIEIGEEVVEPTMADQDIFMRWVTLVADSSAVWNPEFYGTVHSIGKMFDRPAELRYTYVLGNSYADITVNAKENEPGTEVQFKIFAQKLQGIQVYVRQGSTGQEDAVLEALSNPPTNFQMYNLQALVDFVKEQIS